MKTSYIRAKSVLVAIFLVCFSCHRAIAEEALTADNIVTLLDAGMTSKEILPELMKRGYAGARDKDTLSRFKKSGADVALLLEISKPTSAVPVVNLDLSLPSKEDFGKYKKLADEGNAEAQWKLGYLYEKGEGVEVNEDESIKWYRKSADQGSAIGQRHLASMYISGSGVDSDEKEAAKWMSKAAEQGDAVAQSCLGKFYNNGRGVTADPQVALKWLSKAAEQVDVIAQTHLGYMYWGGAGIPEDKKLALELFHKAAEKGNVEAQFILAQIYANGQGVPQDKEEARKWLLKAAEQGNEEAKEILAQEVENAKYFTNSIGMKFMPVQIKGGKSDGLHLLFCIWETRQKDFKDFIDETKFNASFVGEDDDGNKTDVGWNHLEWETTEDHPVVCVSWKAANLFCQWLTEKELKEGKITAKQKYRLPTDHEWSCAVGIGDQENAAQIPEVKSEKVAGYPWGGDWPPPNESGNYYQLETDEFDKTSPVGSFKANAFGLFDMGGNVWEICSDQFGPLPSGMPATTVYRVRRGASYEDGAYQPKIQTLSSMRIPFTEDNLGSLYNTGFRCVLEP